jgi:hypothetical protein
LQAIYFWWRQLSSVGKKDTNFLPFHDLLDKASYAPEAKYPQQAGEEDRTISTGSAAGSDQFGTRSLEPSERRTAEPLPYFYLADN